MLACRRGGARARWLACPAAERIHRSAVPRAAMHACIGACATASLGHGPRATRVPACAQLLRVKCFSVAAPLWQP